MNINPAPSAVEAKTQVEKACRELGIPYYKDKPNPEPSAPNINYGRKVEVTEFKEKPLINQYLELKSAYQKLERELAEMKLQLQFTNSNWPHEKKLHEELDKEREKVAGLCELVKSIKCECKYKPFTHEYFFECKRCEALKRFGDGK